MIELLKCEGVLLRWASDVFKGKDGDEVASTVVFIGSDDGYVDVVKAYGERAVALEGVVKSHKTGDYVSLPVFVSKSAGLVFKG